MPLRRPHEVLTGRRGGSDKLWNEGPQSQEGGQQGHTVWQHREECGDEAENGCRQETGGRSAGRHAVDEAGRGVVRLRRLSALAPAPETCNKSSQPSDTR